MYSFLKLCQALNPLGLGNFQLIKVDHLLLMILCLLFPLLFSIKFASVKNRKDFMGLAVRNQNN
jgi:hypothetical protein